MKRLAAMLLLAAMPARADVVLPSDFVSEEGMRQFQVCRAATFYHLNGPPEPDATLPQSLARTLLDQINFVIFESITNKTPSSVADGQRLLSFTENWILGFGRVIQEEQGPLSDLAIREKVLLDCVPMVWGIVRSNIDFLMEWRARAIDPAPFGSVEERQDAQNRLIERLMTGE